MGLLSDHNMLGSALGPKPASEFWKCSTFFISYSALYIFTLYVTTLSQIVLLLYEIVDRRVLC